MKFFAEVCMEKMRSVPTILTRRAIDSTYPCAMMVYVVGMVKIFYQSTVSFFFSSFYHEILLMLILFFFMKRVLVLEDPINSSVILGYLYRQQQHRILAIADEIMELEVINDVPFFFFLELFYNPNFF